MQTHPYVYMYVDIRIHHIMSIYHIHMYLIVRIYVDKFCTYYIYIHIQTCSYVYTHTHTCVHAKNFIYTPQREV